MSHPLRPHGLQHFSLLCPPLSPGVCSDSCQLNWWCYLTILFSATQLLLCLQSFPAQGLLQWVCPLHQVAKVLELQQQFFQWIFRVDFLQDWLVWSPCSSRDFQEYSLAPQFGSINSSVLSLLYCPNLTSIPDCWKNRSFDYVMCLLFNIPSRLLIAFLPRSKNLLISWLQSPSMVILAPKKIKSVTASTFLLFATKRCGPDAMI